MTPPLAGSAALVTGASSGIGEATARALAECGAAVALLARRAERIERLAAEIGARGGRALALPADVAERAQAEAAVARAAAELGRLDIVVNNAGVMLLGAVADAPVEEWERMVRVNLLGALYVARAALPHLLRAADDSPRRVADLVNIGSDAGRTARAGMGVYNLTKFGLGAFSEALRQELARRRVRVSLIEPGAVATELGSHLRPEIRAQPPPPELVGIEWLTAPDIAEVVAWVVTRPRHVAVNEILVRPTEQER